MFAGSSDAKERIRQAIDIVDLVGSHVDLRRQGRIYVGLCPWHADSRPSMQVNPDRQSWKCWVCDIGGDIFSFVMKREGVDFREAVELLADQAGIDLGPKGKPVVPGSPDDKATLYRAMAWATQQYHEFLLKSADAAACRDYLQSRGINADSIERFKIGFAPAGWQWLLDRCGGRFSNEVLSAVGLALKSEKTGKWLDRFRGRAIFPINDLQSRPIALGGRILPQLADDKSAKYINSPETRLFSKSAQLYAIELARDTIVRDRDVLVMEGYTDVVIAHQSGVTHAVAVLGTALGARHLPLLKRFSDRITLILDGDQAGQRRANEVLDLFIAHQIDLRIVTLPDNLDPCDFLLQHGRDAFMAQVAEAPDAWEHRIRTETRGIDLVQDTHQANRALESLLGLLASTPRPSETTPAAQRLREQQILNRLAREFHLDEHELRERVNERRAKKVTKPSEPRGSEPRVSPKRIQADRSAANRAADRRAADRREADHAAPNQPLADRSGDDHRPVDDPFLEYLESDEPEFWPADDGVFEVATRAHSPIQVPTPHSVPTAKPKLETIELNLFELLLQQPALVRPVLDQIDVTQLRSSPARDLYRLFADLDEAGETADFEHLMLAMDDPQMKNLLVEIDEQGRQKENIDHQLLMNDLIRAFARRQMEESMRRHQAALEAENLNEQEQLDALLHIMKNKLELMGE